MLYQRNIPFTIRGSCTALLITVITSMSERHPSGQTLYHTGLCTFAHSPRQIMSMLIFPHRRETTDHRLIPTDFHGKWHGLLSLSIRVLLARVPMSLASRVQGTRHVRPSLCIRSGPLKAVRYMSSSIVKSYQRPAVYPIARCAGCSSW